ncbi:MAG TPA: hypothetical protein VNA69_23545, partial [Thermoanaerobaculia bacterium]|nr:hypothetical protein [Thermoanaerobaculia bacterium]
MNLGLTRFILPRRIQRPTFAVAVLVLLAFSAPPAFAVEPPSLSSFEWLGFTNSGVSMLRLAGTFPGTTAHQDRKVFLDLD